MGVRCPNIDFQGNEYYIDNGIVAYHITVGAYYKFGMQTREFYGQPVRKYFDTGFYVLSTRRPNYLIIEDSDVLHFILDFPLSSNNKLSLHRELKRCLGVDFTSDNLTII